jgi:hypothetical protein
MSPLFADYPRLIKNIGMGLSLAFLAGNTLAQNTSNKSNWWEKSDFLPAQKELRLRAVELKVQSGVTGRVYNEWHCEINGQPVRKNSGLIADTSNFYFIHYHPENKTCSLDRLVSVRPHNPRTAEELVGALSTKVPRMVNFLQIKQQPEQEPLANLFNPTYLDGVGVIVPEETTLAYMMAVSFGAKQVRPPLQTASACPDGPDIDQDGIPDIQETKGIIGPIGKKFISSPTMIDSDGDGLTDLEELGEVLTAEAATAIAKEKGYKNPPFRSGFCYRNVTSDPTSPDSDGDLVPDGWEIDDETDPLNSDSDGDKLSDSGERLWGTDPLNPDTDNDGISDKQETTFTVNGFNPNRQDALLPSNTFMSLVVAGANAVKGGVCGDICELDTLPELTGAILVSVLPVAGTPADIRDAFANTIKGDYVSAAFAATGLLPFAGDIARSTAIATKFIVRHPDKAHDVFRVMSSMSGLPDIARREMLTTTLKATDPNTHFTLFVKHGLKPETVERLAQGTAKLDNIAKILDECPTCITRDVSHLGDGGWLKHFSEGERHLAGNTQKPKALPPPPRGKQDLRYYDALVVNKAMESKVGYVKADKRILRQIEKDCKMKGTEDLKISVEWHFFASAQSNSIGADKLVLDALKTCKNGPIPFKIHLP